MLQETGIATRAQEMHVAAASRDKGYTPFFSSQLAETGATSASRGGGLLTVVSSNNVAEHEVLSFTEIVPGKAAAREIRTDGGGLTLINVHGPQAGCSPWAGRAAFWAHSQMYATARSLGGTHPVVIAGDTNVYMGATSNLAAKHFRAGSEACGFRRATAGSEEDMIPTLHPSRHSVDTFLVNKPLLPWSLRKGVWARGMAHPQVIGSDHLLVRLALPGLLKAAGHATMPTPYSHTVSRLLTYDAEAAPVEHCLWAGSPPRRMSPPWRPGWVPQSSTPMGPCPRPQWTRCSNTSTRPMTPGTCGGMPLAVPGGDRPGGGGPPRERETAPGGSPPLRHPSSVRAGGIPGARGTAWHPVKGGAPARGGAAGCVPRVLPGHAGPATGRAGDASSRP